MKISDYTAVSDASLDELIDRVGIMIQEGWQPFGNLVIEMEEEFDPIDDSKKLVPCYHQPMVRYASVLA